MFSYSIFKGSIFVMKFGSGRKFLIVLFEGVVKWLGFVVELFLRLFLLLRLLNRLVSVNFFKSFFRYSADSLLVGFILK